MNNLIFTLSVGIALSFVSPEVAIAKDKKAKGGGKKVQVDKSVDKGVKKIPPGQVKRYTRGAKLPSDLDFDNIDDLSKWKLKAPGKGNRYIQVDNEIYEVSEDLSTVVDAIGVVDDWIK